MVITHMLRGIRMGGCKDFRIKTGGYKGFRKPLAKFGLLSL